MSEKATIQAPTIGRGVIFTALNEERVEANGRVVTLQTYPGTIVKVHDDGVVDLVTFGPASLYHNNGIRYGAHGQAGTWQYPTPCLDKIEVDA